VSPRRSCRELLADGFLVLLGRQVFVKAGPLDQQLRNGTSTAWMQSALQNAFRDLEVVVDIRKRRHS
jgi:hypothetical protein